MTRVTGTIRTAGRIGVEPGGRAMKRGTAAAAVLALLLPNFLSAQAAGRIGYTTYSLHNGLRVVLSRDHSTPIVTVNVWYHVGSANERPRRSGFAHLFEHMMFQGSANVRKAEHFQLIERAGGELNGSTTEDRTNYYQTVPSNRLNLALWLEADRMRSLAVTDSNFENQRQAVKEERRLRIDNQPYVRYVIEGFTLPFDSSGCFAYAHTVIGDMADLDSARLEDVQEFFNTWYKPSNAVLAVVGDFDEAEARRLIEQYFGGIPGGTRPPEPECSYRTGGGPRRLTVTDSNANLPAVVLVYSAPPRNHPDAPAFELLATILGQGESSRLNRRLVRRDQAALGAGAIAQARRASGVGLFFGIANQGVSATRVDSLLNDEIARLATDSGRITQEELVKAQNQYRATAIRARQTTMGVAEALQSALRFHGDLEAVNTEIERYRAVTLADLQRVARQYLAPENRLTLVINPPAGRNQ